MLMSIAFGGLVIFWAGAVETTFDPKVDSIIEQVSTDSLSYYIEGLSGEKSVKIGGKKDSITTRHSLTGDIIKATNWLREQFELRGVEAQLQPFISSKSSLAEPRPLPIGVSEAERALLFESLENAGEQFHLNNIVATIPGKDEQQIILCAHYDATSEIEGSYTPGADDNASGCAAVIEAARIFSAYQWQHTIRLVLFSGEEQGLWGSEYYAKDAVQKKDDIIAVLDMDMIAYNGDENPQMELHCCPWIDESQDMGDTLSSLMETYGVNLAPDIHVSDATDRSDHYWFWQLQIPAVLMIEDFEDFTPFYHHITDRISTLDKDFMTDAVKLALAWAAIKAEVLPESTTVIAEQPEVPLDEIMVNLVSPFVKSRLNIDFRSNNTLTVFVYDASGRRVKSLGMLTPSTTDTRFSFDIQDLSSGVYWISLEGAGKRVSQRFVVVR
ncbi:M20/M25/M40 family metallo-hydrolase [bacterium]|nr:M20/M25/M40 family metallo-hydrolase [bacterium]